MKILYPIFSIVILLIISCNKNIPSDSKKETGDNEVSTPAVEMDSDSIRFASGSFIADQKIVGSDRLVQHTQSELIDGKLVRVILFEKLPDNDLKSKMSRDGIELLDYIPNKAFIAFLPQDISYKYLSSVNVKAISEYRPGMKMDKYLSASQFPSYIVEGNMIRINIHPYKNVDLEMLESELLKISNTRVLNKNEALHFLETLTEESNLDSISSISVVKFLEVGYSDPVPDENKD